MRKHIKEIGFETVKLHSRIYEVTGYKKVQLKKSVKYDKNFITLTYWHHGGKMVTNFPLRINDPEQNLVLDPIKKIHKHWDDDWQNDFCKYLPGFQLLPSGWKKQRATGFSNKHGVVYDLINEEGLFLVGISRGKGGFKDKKSFNVKTLGDFVIQHNDIMELHLDKLFAEVKDK